MLVSFIMGLVAPKFSVKNTRSIQKLIRRKESGLILRGLVEHFGELAEEGWQFRHEVGVMERVEQAFCKFAKIFFFCGCRFLDGVEVDRRQRQELCQSLD